MEKLQFIIDLIQEFDDQSRLTITPSWDEKQTQNAFKFTQSRPKYDHKHWLEALKAVQGTDCKVCTLSPVIGHHIFSVELFPEFAEDIENGIILCTVCHAKVHTMLQYLGFVSRTDFEQMFIVKLAPIDGYTVEELAKLSGYSVKTIYNLTAYKVLHPPLRGVDQSKYKSKGLYSKDTLTKLQRFTELKNCGRHSKERILLIMQRELIEEQETIICQ